MISLSFGVIIFIVFATVVTAGFVREVLFWTGAEFMTWRGAVRADYALTAAPCLGVPELQAFIALENGHIVFRVNPLVVEVHLRLCGDYSPHRCRGNENGIVQASIPVGSFKFEDKIFVLGHGLL